VSAGPAAAHEQLVKISTWRECYGWSSTQPRSVRNLKTRPDVSLINLLVVAVIALVVGLTTGNCQGELNELNRKYKFPAGGVKMA
jgi:hypothetical protein